ncbi:hypothetical protein [Allomesorhizobium alhagi]|uniref:Uncharacterized protein n=1 Tax=Mesorhizobium alhagi CCNWXJ12-2 TaxID=1107882 RepID=H0HNI6_9HYPH|nr:hypothetical protein [Mesorhizobium alhagi]EHK57639.1 hypothetical protein MAXJ12_08544 [Mesorhizobium alhagi CCNWXJ12-2]
MTIHQSNEAQGIAPVPYPAFAGHVVTHRFAFAVPADIVEGDTVELAILPANCRVVDMIFDSDDLDTGTPAIVWDIGIMSGEVGSTDTGRTTDDEFFDGSTLSQAGGVARPTIVTAFRTTATGQARSIGAKLVTDAATAAAGTIGLTVSYVAA